MFRGLVCHDRTLECEACPLRGACPYPAVFMPAALPARASIARLREPPRPFVFAETAPERATLAAVEPVDLDLVVVGEVHRLLPYFVVTLRQLGADGIGPRGARFTLSRVHATDAVGVPTEASYHHGASDVRAVAVPLRASDLARPGDTHATRVRVRFRTPTEITKKGPAGTPAPQPVEAPPFGALLRRARDRASALATLYCERPLAIDPRGLGAAADRVTLLHATVRQASLLRKSSRTGERHQLGGVLGEAVYEGPELGPLMPLLRLAELLHVGKHATFGLGVVGVEVVA
ncbi:MAG: CRISPR system precrRNA processing endoribonuclease RAMP protein Cas6 [Polyangiaceae bacterium]|nr:CRISPR system precrRNA processing endoribonuclease RAMP protein Cas6 [Polyangiaceae bacterium]